jgi:predicted phosphodiesterase
MIALIGDVHGKLLKLEEIIRKYNAKGTDTICTEIGFIKEHKYFADFLHRPEGTTINWVLFGNHDYIPWYKEEYSCGNWSYDMNHDLFTIRGAKSIDIHHRTEGQSWWSDEEVSYKEALDIYDSYCTFKPSVVFSHDLPQSIKEELYGYKEKNITNQLLQACLDFHAPDVWVHGHYHDSHHTVIDKTLFVGLNELTVFELPALKEKYEWKVTEDSDPILLKRPDKGVEKTQEQLDWLNDENEWRRISNEHYKLKKEK